MKPSTPSVWDRDEDRQSTASPQKDSLHRTKESGGITLIMRDHLSIRRLPCRWRQALTGSILCDSLMILLMVGAWSSSYYFFTTIRHDGCVAGASNRNHKETSDDAASSSPVCGQETDRTSGNVISVICAAIGSVFDRNSLVGYDSDSYAHAAMIETNFRRISSDAMTASVPKCRVFLASPTWVVDSTGARCRPFLNSSFSRETGDSSDTKLTSAAEDTVPSLGLDPITGCCKDSMLEAPVSLLLVFPSPSSSWIRLAAARSSAAGGVTRHPSLRQSHPSWWSYRTPTAEDDSLSDDIENASTFLTAALGSIYFDGIDFGTDWQSLVRFAVTDVDTMESRQELRAAADTAKAENSRGLVGGDLLEDNNYNSASSENVSAADVDDTYTDSNSLESIRRMLIALLSMHETGVNQQQRALRNASEPSKNASGASKWALPDILRCRVWSRHGFKKWKSQQQMPERGQQKGPNSSGEHITHGVNAEHDAVDDQDHNTHMYAKAARMVRSGLLIDNIVVIGAHHKHPSTSKIAAENGSFPSVAATSIELIKLRWNLTAVDFIDQPVCHVDDFSTTSAKPVPNLLQYAPNFKHGSMPQEIRNRNSTNTIPPDGTSRMSDSSQNGSKRRLKLDPASLPPCCAEPAACVSCCMARSRFILSARDELREVVRDRTSNPDLQESYDATSTGSKNRTTELRVYRWLRDRFPLSATERQRYETEAQHERHLNALARLLMRYIARLSLPHEAGMLPPRVAAHIARGSDSVHLDLFQLCIALCRHGTPHIFHDNRYRQPLHHCYGAE